MARKHIKTMNERAVVADAPVKPKETDQPIIAPPTEAPPRPFRPVPTKRPSEKERTKPIGEYEEIIDLFFEELEKIKDTPEGKMMIKNLHNKYAK
jgi:hypothetical protein